MLTDLMFFLHPSFINICEYSSEDYKWITKSLKLQYKRRFQSHQIDPSEKKKKNTNYCFRSANTPNITPINMGSWVLVMFYLLLRIRTIFFLFFFFTNDDPII